LSVVVLPAPLLAEERDDLALSDLEPHALECSNLTVRHIERLDLKHEACPRPGAALAQVEASIPRVALDRARQPSAIFSP
jgi:hypothetical protein